ncbi:hypothetical protein FACS1894156_2140 [Bacteroidia bacterium]|nr:hypothetical protein FACS1894156_2140 [Bacteroidia bacterium]
MVALFAACNDDYKFDNELDTVTPQGDVTLTAEANTTDFAAVGGSGTITITSSHTWEAASDEDWVTFPDPETGDGLGSVAGKGNAALPFEVEGRTGEIRTAYITLTSGNKEVVLTITQTGTAPGAAELKGSIANEYPDTTVTLTAKASGATHFIWLIDGVAFDTTTESTYVLGLTDTIIGKVFTDYRGEHTYNVQGYNAEGDGVVSNAVQTTIVSLQDIYLPSPSIISGKHVSSRTDSVDRAVGITLSASVVPGATSYKWNEANVGTVYSVDISTIPDSVLYGKDGKGGKIDSILSYTVPASHFGEHRYSVEVLNNVSSVASEYFKVTINAYKFGWKDDIANELVGTWNANVSSGNYYDTLGISTSTSNYTLKISKVNASTIKIVTDFGILRDTATFTATIGLDDESITIALQNVKPAASKGKFHSAYTPAYISLFDVDANRYAAAAGKDLEENYFTSSTTINLAPYLLYRGNNSGEYIGHPITRAPIAATNGVTWTKQ